MLLIWTMAGTMLIAWLVAVTMLILWMVTVTLLTVWTVAGMMPNVWSALLVRTVAGAAHLDGGRHDAAAAADDIERVSLMLSMAPWTW